MQILIYVGAIVILFLFGLMLTKAPIGRDDLDNQLQWLAIPVAALVFAGLVFLIQDAFPVKDAVATESFQASTGVIGESLFRDYVLPFEAVSFLLLAALIGAIVLAQEGRRLMVRLPFVLFFSALLFSAGVYGVLARRNAVMVLMAIELMLNAVNVNLVGVLRAAEGRDRPDLRPVRDRRGRRRGRDRPRDRDPALPQPCVDQRRRGEPPQVVAARLRSAAVDGRRQRGSSSTRG